MRGRKLFWFVNGFLLTGGLCDSSVMGMQVHFSDPEIQAKVEQWATETGRPADELIEGVMASYFDELAQVRKTLDGRYDDVKSGKIKLIDGEEAFERLRAKSEAWRKSHS